MMGAGRRLIRCSFHSREAAKRRWIERFEIDPGRACRATPEAQLGPPFVSFQAALRLRPRRAISSPEADDSKDNMVPRKSALSNWHCKEIHFLIG